MWNWIQLQNKTTATMEFQNIRNKKKILKISSKKKVYPQMNKHQIDIEFINTSC